MSDRPTPVHAGPPFGEALTTCCRRTPLELPVTDRVTYNLGDVTCGREEPAAEPLVHIEPIPAPAGAPHGEGFAFELEHVTCEVCKAGVVGAVRAQRPVERQTWERRLGGTDVAEVRIHVEVDAEGRVRIHEALAARLLHEAGWERTA